MKIKTSYVIVAAILAVCNAEYKSYKNHKVLRVYPRSDKDVTIINKLKGSGEWHFWSNVVAVNGDVRIMVEPEKLVELKHYLTSEGISSKVVIEDVHKLIDDQLKRPQNANRNIESYSWEYYQTLDEINAWLDHMVEKHSNVASIISLGQSVEERDIRGIKIDYRKQEKPVIGMIESTIHAREWIAPVTATWVIKELLESDDPDVRAMAENVVWHIFPVTNPDGYEYTFTTNRMWRKNRSKANYTSCDHFGVDSDMSNGIDLNRNFGYLWMFTGASQDPCSNVFAGPVAFSEPEATGLANYVTKLQEEGDLVFYYAIHSYSQLVLVPFSHVGGSGVLTAPNYGDMYEIAIKGTDMLKKKHGTDYIVGTSGDVMYEMSGTSYDWVKGEAKVPVVYLLELRDVGEYGFLLPPEQIIPNNEEVMAALVEMDKVTRSLGYYYSSFSPSVNAGVSVLMLSVLLALVM